MDHLWAEVEHLPQIQQLLPRSRVGGLEVLCGVSLVEEAGVPSEVARSLAEQAEGAGVASEVVRSSDGEAVCLLCWRIGRSTQLLAPHSRPDRPLALPFGFDEPAISGSETTLKDPPKSLWQH